MEQGLQLLLSLIILVVLHELGHFMPAKLFKTKVEKFYLFFNPWFSIFRFKKGETEYGIGWLPLGGYVKIAGMIDESMDKEQMKKTPQPWEFRAKPAWQRLIIMIGGVIVNILFGIFLYAMVLFVWGKEYLPVENVKYGIACDSLALKMGLRDGDKILSVDNEYIESLHKIPAYIVLNKAQTLQVERNGEKINIPITENDLSQMIKAKLSFFTARIPNEVDTVLTGNNAEKAGMKKGDKIFSINGAETPFYNDVQRVIQQNKGREIALHILRGNDTLHASVQVSEEGTIGIGNKPPSDFLEVKTLKYGFFESFPAGVAEGYEKIVMLVKQFSVLFSVKDAHQSLGGFYSIARMYDPGWDWHVFWTFTAFLSIMLGFMNFLPIPVLDGGYILFLTFEILTRIKVPDKVIEYANYVGFFLLISLMLYANTDWFRH